MLMMSSFGGSSSTFCLGSNDIFSVNALIDGCCRGELLRDWGDSSVCVWNSTEARPTWRS